MPSLVSRQSPLSRSEEQFAAMRSTEKLKRLTPFADKLKTAGLFPLTPIRAEFLQVNVGKLCNQTCKHCHVDAGPDRTEVMTRATLEQVLALLDRSTATTVDITGGAPEMNPHFRWFVDEVWRRKKKVMVRCNLTILVANARYYDLPSYYASRRVHVVCSLPYYDKRNTDRQRGDGVFDRSILALELLNREGYGKAGTGLELDLVYNPVGAFLPAAQSALEADFKRELKALFGVEFNRLYAITNMPISRFLEYLVESGNLEAYMEKLVHAFNPQAASGVMCRNTISIGWDGYVYDCDFNQMLEMKITDPLGKPLHVSTVTWEELERRAIRVDQHCYGCTAGLGSSCGGNVVEYAASFGRAA